MNNPRLLIGCMITVFFLVIAMAGPMLAPYEPDYQEAVQYVEGDDGYELIGAPFPPSVNHWFGTDEWGYDILSLLLYGAKYTLFTSVFTALFRILIGGTAGLVSGMRKRKINSINIFGLLGSIPSFLIIYFVMVGIVINSTLPSWKLALIQGGLMTAIGVPGVYATISEKTAVMRENLFVIASKSLGGSKLHIIKRHILPYIKGTLSILFFKEIISVLGLIGQLGIFELFLGGTIRRETAPFIRISETHEWAGIIGQWRLFIYDSQWILFFPLCALVLLILGFYLIIRGLEQQQKGAYNRYPYI